DDLGSLGLGGAKSTQRTVNITVTNPPVTITQLNPVPGTVVEGGATLLSGTFTNAAPLDTHTVVILWGDGQSSTLPTLGAGVRSFTASHNYADDIGAGTSNTLL